MTNYDVPFIGNSSDDMHCLQASYLMIRNYFEPEAEEIPWDTWAELTGFIPGKGTWSMAGLMWFKDHGYEVAHIGTFDYGRFAEEGIDYLIDALGEEVGNWEAGFVQDVSAEQARALRFIESGTWIKRVPTLDDIYGYLNNGYLVKCLVNLKALDDLPGYLGHAVVVKGYTKTDIILHDPGLPARPNRHVPIDTFLRAWTNPLTKSEKMDAIRKGNALSIVKAKQRHGHLSSASL